VTGDARTYDYFWNSKVRRTSVFGGKGFCQDNPIISGANGDDMSNNSRPIILVAATAASAAASFWLYQSVASYGWEGTLRYVWEGDPYTPQVREYIDILDSVDDAETSSSPKSTTTDKLPTTNEIVRLWMSNFETAGRGDLEKNLAYLSTVLDKLAAQVDGVLVGAKDGADSSRTWMELKRRKRLLSKQLVLAMERADALLASFQVLQEQRKK
jgi:hypothetical protein